MHRRIGVRVAALASVLALAVVGCAAPEMPAETKSPSVGIDIGDGVTGWWSPTDAAPETVATGLDAPWSVIPFEDGYFVSERDSGAIMFVSADGTVSESGAIEDVLSGGESGLHGLELLETGDATYLYAYYGAADDNRVVQMPIRKEPGSDVNRDLPVLGEPEPIVTGIPRANTHNGGRIHFGPDGYLYISTGDAQQRDAAQDPQSLGGKILRVDAEGNPAPDNPFGNEVFSLGHRNVQGFAWTSDGVMWASEFGQDTWDELNRIEPGGNYGWPTVEGIAEDDRFIDPSIQWAPSEASPSGIAAKDDTLFIAGLRGQRLWIVNTVDGEVVGEPIAMAPDGVDARLRDVRIDSDGTLLILTNNTDGRGSPGAEDDRIVRLMLELVT